MLLHREKKDVHVSLVDKQDHKERGFGFRIDNARTRQSRGLKLWLRVTSYDVHRQAQDIANCILATFENTSIEIAKVTLLHRSQQSSSVQGKAVDSSLIADHFRRPQS